MDLAGITVGLSIVSLYMENWFGPEEAAEERRGPSQAGEKDNLDYKERSESRKGVETVG